MYYRETIIATIKDLTTGVSLAITKSAGASAPACLQFSDRICGYWETRLELFLWACDAARFYPLETIFEDRTTGRFFDYFDLLDEADDEYAA